MWNKLPEDNFLFGIIAGSASLMLTFFVLRSARVALADYYGNPYFFPSPRVELISILINILFFRVVIVNMKKDKTGRGILFTTVLISMIFFFLYFKMNYSLS